MATTLQDGSKSRKEWFDIMAAMPDPYSGEPGIEKMGEAMIHRRLDSLSMLYPKALQDGLDGSLEWDADEKLKQIACPVTLLSGNPDIGSVMSGEEAAHAATVLADCTHVHFDDVGHLVHDEKPAAWLDAVNGWLSR